MAEQLILPVIDSHMHVYPASETDSIAWHTPDHPLAGQHSLDQYRAATRQAPSLLGFVFVETDRKSNVDNSEMGDGSKGWDAPLQEIRWISRVALGTPREGEGHNEDDKRLCLGIVPWAPLPGGVHLMEEYLALAEEAAGEAWSRVKGFRYLLQDKPHGTMLEDSFVEAAKLLGRRGFVFEVGVDQHRRGKRQLEELVTFVERVHDGVPEDERVTLILNHLCKPDLTIYNLTSDPGFTAWRTAMYTLSKDARVYVKLSGAFSEMTDALRREPANRVFESTLGWLGVVLATFGPGRIMFGSDWPVCEVGFEGEDGAWVRWRDVVERMCWMATLGDEERAMIFGGTAKKAYGL